MADRDISAELAAQVERDQAEYPFLPKGWTLDRWREAERMHQQGTMCEEPR